MRKLIASLVNYTLQGNNKEGFSTLGNHHPLQLYNKNHFWGILVSFILVEILLLFVGKFLWNKVATKLVPGLNNIKSIWQILGISILIKLLTN